MREIRLYAEKQDIQIVAEYLEAASAFQKNGKRTEFYRMLAQAKADPQVSLILVHDFSRFSRDSLQAKSLVRELRESGIRVVSLNDPEFDPESVVGVYMEAITFAKNEAYSREVAFHTRKGCRANVQTRDPETGWCYKNGGQPLWGYRYERLVRGNSKKGEIHKSIWVLDDTVVNGRPVHAWARYCLVELAAKGASLSELRDFCNKSGIPGRRKPYWSTFTWNAILQPSVLLQYLGYGVWNVRKKNGQEKPSSEWVIVDNAHPALLSQEEVLAIGSARKKQREKRFDAGYGKSRITTYLLSGGLFKCGRCGGNMIGLHRDGRYYYVCGSEPYRRGIGCGPGVYVPKQQVESEAIGGLQRLLSVCTNPQGFTRKVNQELRRIWQASTGFDPHAECKVVAIDSKIANIHRAIEEGLQDADWANERLCELVAERKALTAARTAIGSPPQIDVETALEYRRDLGKLLRYGEPLERKRFLRTWIQEARLSPESLEVEITFQMPGNIMEGVVAGVGFEPTTFGL